MPDPHRAFTVKSHVYCLDEGKSHYTVALWLESGDQEMQELVRARGYLPLANDTLWTLPYLNYQQLRAEVDWLTEHDGSWE